MPAVWEDTRGQLPVSTAQRRAEIKGQGTPDALRIPLKSRPLAGGSTGFPMPPWLLRDTLSGRPEPRVLPRCCVRVSSTPPTLSPHPLYREEN